MEPTYTKAQWIAGMIVGAILVGTFALIVHSVWTTDAGSVVEIGLL